MNRRSLFPSSVRTAACALLLVALLLGGGGCTHYVTPGRAADFSAFGLTEDIQRSLADGGVQAMLDRRTAAATARADMLLIYTIDTRNAYLYGSAEATTNQKRLANAWTSRDAAERSRRGTEREAFEALLGDFQRAWGQVLANYDTPRRSAAAVPRG